MTNEFSNKNVLITGGLGFIGSNLAKKLLTLGAKVSCVDNLFSTHGGNPFNIQEIKNDIIIHTKDVRDIEFMSQIIKGTDFLFNLAGQTSHLDSMTDPQTDLEINANAQLSILESCRKINPGIRIVFASTRQLYGKPDYLPVDEAHPIRPVDVNGINKWSGEQYHILYNNVYGIRSTALRLTNTYGPRMRVKDARQTFLGIWIKSVLSNEPFLIYGDGSQLRDFNFVDDVTEALCLASINKKTEGQIYNLGSEEVVSLSTLAKYLIEVNQSGECKKIPFPEDRKSIDIGDYYSNHQNFTNLTGWEPKTNLKNGLKNTLDFYKSNKSQYW
ncbi:MAG: NAD-dependent epimerase/dehydratase family protein [Oligoflexia bacterium]|nr:NAD-dependent epimerase/dehydratase family protein [Oligoflexia bacterium]